MVLRYPLVRTEKQGIALVLESARHDLPEQPRKCITDGRPLGHTPRNQVGPVNVKVGDAITRTLGNKLVDNGIHLVESLDCTVELGFESEDVSAFHAQKVA